jgi:hypothetical protein
MAKAFASAGLNTLAGHKQAMKDIAAKRDKYDDALTKVDELERGERKGTAKDRRAAILSLGQIDADLSKSMANLAGERGTIAFQMWKEQKADARTQSSRSPDQLALLTKYPAGTKEGDTLRDNIAFMAESKRATPGAADVVKSLNTQIERANMLLLGKKDPTERALIQEELRALKAELAKTQGRRGSVGGGGSGTLNAADQALLDKYR